MLASFFRVLAALAAAGLVVAAAFAQDGTATSSASSTATSTATAPAEPDPRALAVVDRSLAAMGGAEAWAATRFLRFDFFGFRLHHWDRASGRHRVEGKTREGQSYVLLENVGTHEGEAWVDGVKLEGEAAREWLGRAYEAWINDTYWLLAPYKLRDPGVHLAYGGEEVIDGRPVDVVEVSFDHVGLTPGDRYWTYFDRESGLMTRWAYHLEDWPADRKPTVWRWEGWSRHGGVMLASERVNPDGDDGPVTRSLGRIAVFENLPDEVFTSPAPVAAGGGE